MLLEEAKTAGRQYGGIERLQIFDDRFLRGFFIVGLTQVTKMATL